MNNTVLFCKIDLPCHNMSTFVFDNIFGIVKIFLKIAKKFLGYIHVLVEDL